MKKSPERSQPILSSQIVGWAVGHPLGNPALYNLNEKEKAFNAARRWNKPIVALVVHPDAPQLSHQP